MPPDTHLVVQEDAQLVLLTLTHLLDPQILLASLVIQMQEVVHLQPVYQQLALLVMLDHLTEHVVLVQLEVGQVPRINFLPVLNVLLQMLLVILKVVMVILGMSASLSYALRKY